MKVIQIPLSLSLCSSLLFPLVVQAQSIQIDGTTPTTTPANCSGNCTITGGINTGNNLFHSFLKFNVDGGATVYFNDPGVINILSRVTGNEASNILGQLGVTGGNANLFLMNPNGIIFGENASLDLKGSFVATTASAIEFANGGRFNSKPVAGENLSALTVNPSAFLFNQIASQSIINRSQAVDPLTPGKTSGLRGSDGKSLLFVGGDVTFDGGKATSLSGLVQLAGIVGTGKLGIQYFGTIPTLNPEAFRLDSGRYSNIVLDNQSVINTTATPGANFSASGATIHGQSVKILGNSRINTSVLAPEDFGKINITAIDDILLNNSGISSAVESGATGNSGGIFIEARELKLANRSFLQTLVRQGGIGNAGKIVVETSGDVTLQGDQTGIFGAAQAGSSGTGGGIDVQANSVLIQDGAAISVRSEGTGKAGDIVVIARRDVNLNHGNITAESSLTGGGNITVRAHDIRMRNGSLISTSVYGEAGDSGDILLVGSDPNKSTFVALEDSDILAAAANGTGGNVSVRDFRAFIVDRFATVPKDFINANIFRGNRRVDISASSRVSMEGSVDVPEITALPETIAALGADFVSADQMVTETCLARRNSQRGSFVVTGSGGLPPTPYDYSTGSYGVTQVQPIPADSPSLASPPPQPQSRRQGWKLGDRIQEARELTRTPQGQIIASAHHLPVASAEDLICHSETPTP